MDGAVKTRDNGTRYADRKGWKAEMQETCISLLKDESNLLKRKELPGCDLEVVSHKVADAKGKISDLVDGFNLSFDSKPSQRKLR